MPGPKLAVLIAQHPALNHAVILREVRLLRARFDVFTISMRAPDRPPDRLSADERDEQARTYYINPLGIRGALRAHAGALASRPAGYWRGLKLAWKLGRTGLGGRLRYFFYFSQALMIGQWVMRHGIGHLHVHYASTVGLLAERVFPVGLSISFHGPDEFNDPVRFHIREKVAACRFARAISFYARSQLMRAADRADWGRIEVVYMGVDPSAFTPRPYRPAPRPFEVITVGRLAPVKAQHVLVEAIRILVSEGRSVLLHMAGGGPDRESLEEAIRAKGLEQAAVLHGFVTEDGLMKLYGSADAFALASFAEGVPGVLMEAMAMEIPCVSTFVNGIPELIQDGVSGMLVAPGDAGGMAGAIARLMDEPDLRRRLGEAARRQVLAQFDLAKNSERLARLFEEHLDAGEKS